MINEIVDNQQTMSAEMLLNIKKLTEREQKYFRMMWPKSGVLYITAKPGVAKSAIARSIASKMEFFYSDIRLSMVDETDVGLYPNVSSIEIDQFDGSTSMVKCLDFVVPRWAIEANKRPTIIHFEELNRASLPVRNAALQILLERAIGVDFKFNDNVLFIASGNLGDEDGTDVEEFDAALNGRLIHVSHTLGAQEWIDNFAVDNVHSDIVSFIKNYPDYLYKKSEEDRAYASPRSWTFLSDFISHNFGRKCMTKEYLPYLEQIAFSYIGKSAKRFLQYCQDLVNINLDDVLNNYPKIKEELERFNRDKKSELLQTLRERDLTKLNDKQVNNLIAFLRSIGPDELTAYLLFLVDANLDISDEKISFILKSFKEALKKIKSLNHKNANPS